MDAPGEHLLEELGERIDQKRVHMFGRLPHDQLQKLYRRSDLHIYLSSIRTELEPAGIDGVWNSCSCRGESNDERTDQTRSEWCALVGSA